MSFEPLPLGSPVQAYEEQAEALLGGWRAGDPETVRLVKTHHPKFLDERIPWLPKRLSDEEARSVPFDLEDARLGVARGYSFLDWSSLADWVDAVNLPGSPVARFEAAVEAVISGDAPALTRLLDEDPELVRRRSTIATCHDPAVHGATLLHYTAANGVEGYRQKTPPNAVEIARLLLEAGSEPDALAGMYGGQCTTMSMLVSSCHPANAGVQVPLVETLVDYGAAVESHGEGHWTSPLMTALAFGYTDSAEALVRRGARVETLPAAAGMGQLEDVRRRLTDAGAEDRHRALALAAQHGRAEVLRLLLEAGEDPNRLNPEGNHAHSTPLHQAACAGHLEVVQLLVERGARLDIRDAVWDGTPLGWAEHCGKPDVAEYLRGRGAQ